MNYKKCIVLDLDNTLWGGIIGEDGLDKIKLSLTPPGSGFVAFQQALLDYHHRGIMLAINSRNNPAEAWEVIRKHPNMILKEQHFSAARINWQDKAQNMRELAQELNIGLDSMVFLDDDPTNRALVKSLIPETEVPEMPADPMDYARFLNSLPYFPAQAVTDEDAMRGNLYVTERLRKEAEKNHPTKEDFLTSLGLQLSIWQDDSSCLPRLAQLTEKTNQFNVHKNPLTETDIAGLIASPDYRVFHARLQDRFGDYGVIAMAVINNEKEAWRIGTLLMSCRVFSRGVEDAFLSCIMEQARKSGAATLTVAFQETPKNVPAKDFVLKHFDTQHRRNINPPLSSPSWIDTIYENI